MTMPQQKPGKSNQSYQTPPEFLEAVKSLLAIPSFDLDLAASSENTVCPDFYGEAYDSLKRQGDWVRPGYCWLNPPYANCKDWVKKACSERAQGAKIAVLVPASTGSNWWRDWAHRKAAVLLLQPRISFVGTGAPYPKDLALLLYEHGEWEKSYDVWNWKTGVLY